MIKECVTVEDIWFFLTNTFFPLSSNYTAQFGIKQKVGESTAQLQIKVEGVLVGWKMKNLYSQMIHWFKYLLLH
jgi:hypothetical protein